MKTLNEIFDEIIHENTQKYCFFDRKNPEDKTLKLEEEEDTENNKKTQLLSVIIDGIEEVYSVFKLDEKKHLFLMEHGLIRKGKFHKKCDFLVFCKISRKNYILLIEMKSENATHIPEKIKSTKAIIAFLQELIQNYYQKKFSNFTQIAILFDKKDTKGKVVNVTSTSDIIYKHQGFSRQTARTEIKKFLG